MQRRLIVGAVTLAVTAALATGAAGALAGQPSGPEGASETATIALANAHGSRSGPHVVGLTRDGQLVTFRADRPSQVRRIGSATAGLAGDRRLVGIDFRVQNGKLYAVGDQGGIYLLNTTTGHPTKVSQLTVPLSGQRFGVDFNPAANRLRVISDTGQNLRHNIDDPAGAPPAGTTVADTSLTTPPAAGTTTGLSAAGYTNNDLDPATATTLFDVNTTTDQVVAQSPANAGTLAPTGGLSLNASGAAGFDVYSDLAAGRTRTNTGYAALAVDGRQQFYQISLLTGEASNLGAFPARFPVTEIAVTLDR